MLERLMNEEEAAEVLGITASALRVARCKGKGPHYCKFGRTVRYEPAAIRQYINDHRQEPGLIEQPIIPEQFRWRRPKHKRIG